MAIGSYTFSIKVRGMTIVICKSEISEITQRNLEIMRVYHVILYVYIQQS